MLRRCLALGLFVITPFLVTSLLRGDDLVKGGKDWPQWRGPNRDNISPDTGLLKEWPKDGPKLLWNSRLVNKTPTVGIGYASVSIAGGRIFTMGDIGDKEHVFALDRETGKELWAQEIAPKFNDGGPRCTPTVDGDRVYALTPHGILVCLKTSDGSLVWQKHLEKDFGGRMMSGWRYSESPTIDGDKLVCTPGGDKAALVALNKLTGDLLWQTPVPKTGGSGYASIVTAQVGSVRVYLTLLGKSGGLVGVDAATGKHLFNYNKIANGTANIPTSIVKGDMVFCSTGYRDGGSALLKLLPTPDGGVKAEEIRYYDDEELQNHHGGMVLLGDHIYGGHGHNNGLPFCLNMKTGELAWGPIAKSPGGGSAAVVYADGHLYFRYQNNTMALIEATPKAFILKSKFQLPKDVSNPGWQHPVVLDGRLYIRANNQILCYDVKQ